MDTVVSSAGGSRRGSLDETSPLPFEFEIRASRKRVLRREGRSQDETAPFPFEFEVVARKSRQSQDETSPFLLEFRVVLPNGNEGFVRTARPPRGAANKSLGGLPRLKWHGVDAAIELRRYAALIAAGESLPPYRGPILANGELPQLRAPAPQPPYSAPQAPAAAAADSKGLRRLALSLLVMSALVVASLLLGDDAQLRHVGQSISRWLSGRDDSAEMLRTVDSLPSP